MLQREEIFIQFCKYKYSINLWSFPKNVLIRLYNCSLLSTIRYIVVTSKLLAMNSNREVKHHVYVKRRTQICSTWPSFPVTCCLRFIISTHKLVVSRNFLSIRIVLNCFYLLIFYFEKFSTWTWRLPYTWRLNSLINGSIIPGDQRWQKYQRLNTSTKRE